MKLQRRYHGTGILREAQVICPCYIHRATLHGSESARIIYQRASNSTGSARGIQFMPIYEYECRKCRARSEVFQKMDDKPPAKCSKCGGKLEKLFSASAIQFKGSGWYVTDYAGNGRKAAEKAETDASSASDKKDATTASDKKAEKKTKEGSPAKKSSEKASSTKAPTGD
jgi:putative FmdB family regulatory protein